MIEALPDAEPWRAKAPGYGTSATATATEAKTEPLTRMDREAAILREVRKTSPKAISISAIARETGIPKGTVSADVKRLMGFGQLGKTDDGIVLGAEG